MCKHSLITYHLLSYIYTEPSSPTAQTHTLTFLGLLFNLNDIVFRHVLQQPDSLLYHLHTIATDVALHDDLVQPLRVLRHGCAGRELLGEELGSFLQVNVWYRQSDYYQCCGRRKRRTKVL